MLSPRKAEHSGCEPECFLPPHLTDFQRRPPPQCWETLIHMAPTICGPNSVIPLQLCPACLGLSTCPRVLAIEQVLFDLPSYLSLHFLTQKPAFLLCGGVS